MIGPAIGGPDPGRAALSRSRFVDAGGGILVILALGLTLRLIIAYLLPGSGFRVDLQSFRFWADNLADAGLYGFYARDFFHDYTPGYLYVLWIVGGVGNFLGGVGDLIKIPPILADLALGYLVWSMVKELGGSERAARLGALIMVLNPVTWLDSVVWGQVDSFGVVFLLLALRELWRDRPERAAILATVAALIKPQLGILIPIVAIVVIRRALWPKGAYGPEGPPEPLASTTRWEERIRGPVRIVTTGLAGVLTAILVSLPFGLSFPGLIAQIFKTAAGYPYLSVNAFNPWALYAHTTVDGREESIALNRAWVCDSVIVPSGPTEFRIGPFVIPELGSLGSDMSCPDGVLIGAFPAALVGAVLFLIAAAVTVWLVARRPDRLTMLTGLAVLALAFFVLPTRVHERYLFPLAAIGAILAAVSLRWRIAYVVSGAATFANMYVVLTTFYTGCLSPGADPNNCNPSIQDWLGIGGPLSSFWGVAVASITQAVVLGWTFLQLRGEAVDSLAESVERAGRRPDELESSNGDGLDLESGPDAPGVSLPTRRLPRWAEAIVGAESGSGARDPLPAGAGIAPGWATGSAAGRSRSSGATPRETLADANANPSRSALAARAGDPDPEAILPAWDITRDAGSLGPIAWLKARMADSPVRANRSRALNTERGGRLDRLDLWVLAVLAVSLLTVRMWRLDEPYQMHFDEVYHPRTATEFLQDWRYDLSHDIYEWTHPHLAKYAMALGLMAFGEDRVTATSDLGVAVLDAVVEDRRDDRLDASQVEGDRLWIATGNEVLAYDLATRELAGTLPLPEAVALAYDSRTHQLYVGTRAGEIRAVDVEDLDASRRGPPVQVESRAWMDLETSIQRLYVDRDGSRMVATLQTGVGTTDPASSLVVVIDASGAFELGRQELPDVGQVAEGIQDGRFFVATSEGVAVIDPDLGTISQTIDVGGPARGVVGINDIENDPIYVTVETPEGPKYVVIIAKRGEEPRVDRTETLPGSIAGRAFYDLATRMVHLEGSVPGSVGETGTRTIYVIEPHANAIYADAALPYVPTAIVLDENQLYPSSDREQLLAFDQGGQVASVSIGRHAYAWRVPGVLAGILMALFLYVLARLLFQRRAVAIFLGIIVLLDGMLFVQSRIGMNDSYVGLGIIGAYTIFTALWLHPGDSRRHWLAFALGVPIIGLFLGFALAAKWVAAFAIGGLGILVLVRSALGRLILLAGLVVITTVLGYVAISVAPGTSGGNYLFLVIMVGLLMIAALANVLHPIKWTWEEVRFAVGAPIAAGLAIILFGLSRGDAAGPIEIGPIALSTLELGLLAFITAGVVWVGFLLLSRVGFGPFAPEPTPDDPTAILEPPAEAPRGWLRLGTGWGLPAVWLALGLIVLPLGLYVASYLPWAAVENHQIVEGWPAGNTGETLLQVTERMYRYHNDLPNPHPASSPWWAWTLDLKPVWFYEEGFAGSTSGSIYDAGNLVAWWLAVPAMIFVAWQAFRRRSSALALIAIGFACQWISWARIDRAAFQYHYYTALPFLFLALAYFLAELWHGTSRRIWLFSRIAAGIAVLGPFLLWLLHRPLCAIVRVTDVNPGSEACPTEIPEVTITVRAIAIAVVMGVGVLLLLRELFAITDEDQPAELANDAAVGGWRGALAKIGLGGRWAVAAVIGVVTTVAFLLVSTLLEDGEGIVLEGIPVEPIAVVVLLALSPVAAYVATARDSRRFVLGALGAMAIWFVLWYPNIAGLPLPVALHNAYQGFLPTYLYPFQFAVNNADRAGAPSLFAIGPAIMLVGLTFLAVALGYSAWSWRIALAERRRDQLAGRGEPPPAAAGAE